MSEEVEKYEKAQKSEYVLLLENLTATLSQLLQQKSGNSHPEGIMSAMMIKLDGKNFNLWSQMLKMKLSVKDKLGYIDGSTPKPLATDIQYRKWQMEDSSVKDYIIESMDPSLVGNFLPFSTAKEVWDSVRTTFFDGDDLTQFFDLKRRVNRVKQAGGSVEVYYTQLQGLWKELDVRRPNPMTSPVDIEKHNNLVQEDRVLTFLDGLDDRLDSIRATVLQLKPFPTIEQAFALVRREENRQTVMLNKWDGSENSMVMLVRNQTLAINKPDFKPKPSPVEGCTYCHNSRHTRDKCFKLIGYPPGWKDRKKKRQGDGQQYRGEAQMVAADSNTVPIVQDAPVGLDVLAGQIIPTIQGVAGVNQAYAAYISAGRYSLLPPVENNKRVEGKNCLVTNNSYTNEFDWIIDSGATDRMTYSEKDLVKISTPRRTAIINANGESYPVKGAGDVQCSLSLTLSNTLLVPSLSTKLLSVGQICEELNCVVLMYPQFCIFQDLLTKEIIGRGTRRRLYHLDDMVVGKAHFSTSSSTNRISRIWMWHKRLGHPSFGYMKRLYPSLFFGCENEKFDCKTCIRAKSHRVSFPSSLNKSTKPFDLVHSDVWDPSPVNSSVGNRWFVLFIDNCTRMTWLYVLKTKDEVSHIFKSFFNMVQNQFNRNIKFLRSDNGGEFVNNTLREFFHSKGIIHETSCVGTPQQNGVDKRKNRHVLETARSMLFEYDVPQIYWDHAITAAVYLINRMPSNVLNFQTPLQVLSSHVPISSVLNIPPKVFGCVAYKNINDQNWNLVQKNVYL
jgi:GAG-pre-integrase domain/Integrase core domain/gag-polypeptide of LTR copia-type